MLPHSKRFVRESVAPLWPWYVAGTTAVVLTNWMSVEVPLRMAAGLDFLRAGQTAEATNEAYLIGGLGLGVIVVRTLSRLAFFTPARRAEHKLRGRFFDKLLSLQPDFYATNPTGDLLSRATTDVTFARALAGFAVLQGLNVVTGFAIALTQMLRLSPLLTAMVAVPCVVAWAVLNLATKRLMTLQRQSQKQLGALSDELLSSFQGVATVQGFGVEEVFGDRLNSRANEMRETNLAMTRLRAVAFPLLTVAGGVATWGLLVIGGEAVREGAMSAGDLAAFIALVAFIVMPLRMVGWLLPVFQRSEAALERLYAVLDTPVDRPDLPVGEPVAATGPTIELRKLSFAFPDAPDRLVLNEVSAVIPAGSTVGVFGTVGSGKSTLLRLLARLVNPPAGTVFVNGVDVRRLDLDAWRGQLCVVPQAPFLFSESVRENIGFGAADEEVTKAAELAALGPDLAALPEGLGTVVGERGITLSGGQRQRVALARGLVRPASVVLLDDVLSAVDHGTEQELLATLRSRAGATRLIVSHRLSALVAADTILVLDAGRLVDQGTHRELLDRPGPYRDAWQAQAERGEAS